MVDNAPPVTAVTVPVTGTAVHGTSVTLDASATDNVR